MFSANQSVSLFQVETHRTVVERTNMRITVATTTQSINWFIGAMDANCKYLRMPSNDLERTPNVSKTLIAINSFIGASRPYKHAATTPVHTNSAAKSSSVR